MQTKLHAKLKWETLIERINKRDGFERFKLDRFGQIWEYWKTEKNFYFMTTTLFDKQEFINSFAR